MENKPAFGGTQGKAYSLQDFRDIKNLKLSLHLGHINYLFLKKKLNYNFMKFFEMHLFFWVK